MANRQLTTKELQQANSLRVIYSIEKEIVSVYVIDITPHKY